MHETSVVKCIKLFISDFFVTLGFHQSFKPGLHILFTHAFSELKCVFEDLT